MIESPQSLAAAGFFVHVQLGKRFNNFRCPCKENGMFKKRVQNLSLALVLIATATAWAQDTGTLTGTVTDPTSAVVANAQVTATNAATNFETATETNAEGIYRIPFLRP